MTSRLRRATALGLVTASFAAAIPAAAGPAAAAPSRRLPPHKEEKLVDIFDPRVEELGLRTTRARLQDLDTYEITRNGRHLAVYLEPIDDDFEDAEYVERFTEVAEAFLPMVFKRWKRLKSFDVCLEPRPAEDEREAPPPVTQLLVTRPVSKDIDWEDVTLVDLLVEFEKVAEKEKEGRELTVYLEPELDRLSELREARAAAEERLGDS